MTPTSVKALVAAAFAAMYAAVGLIRHAHFGSNAYDLGLFDQMVWHLSRFELPASTIHGLSNMFGDHFSPIHVLFVPLSWIWPSAESLIATQAIFLALSIIPVWMFCERRLPARAALLLALAYGCFWGIQRAAQFDVHEFAFAPLLISVMLLALDVTVLDGKTSARWWLLGSAVLLCLVKEDQIPIVATVFALWAWRTPNARDRRTAAVFMAAALCLFVAVVKVVIPALNDHGAWSVGSAFSSVGTNPLSLLARLVSPSVKVETMAMWIVPFAALPLASPYGLLLAPFALERFLSASSNHWGTSFHYTAPVAPVLAIAAADGLARVVRMTASHVRPNLSSAIAATCLLLCAILPGRLPMWQLLSPSTYKAPAFADAARRALALIPADASVTAQSSIAPHLTRRQEIHMLGGAGELAGLNSDYVIAADVGISVWPLSGSAELAQRLRDFEGRGYQRVFDEQGWVVLQKAEAR